MARHVSSLLPSTGERLRQLGERLRLARRRRRLSARQVAARAGMAPMTLRSVERGGAGVTIGAYAAVMQVLGLEKDLDLVAAADSTGRALQDARLSAPRRAARLPPPVPDASNLEASEARSGRDEARVASSKSAPARGFSSAQSLAALIDEPTARRSAAKRH